MCVQWIKHTYEKGAEASGILDKLREQPIAKSILYLPTWRKYVWALYHDKLKISTLYGHINSSYILDLENKGEAFLLSMIPIIFKQKKKKKLRILQL